MKSAMKWPNLQLTLGIIKPDASQMPHNLQLIKSSIDKENFGVVRYKITRLRREEAELFYIEHKNKFFYHRLVTFMSSGPLHVFILAQKNAIAKWRSVMGPTKVFRAYLDYPKTIRGQFGLTDTRNTTHGSDGVYSALNEISFFFPEFSAEEWKRQGYPIANFTSLK